MAYCVHCGVKLGDAEATCPLCGTERCDAKDPSAPTAPRPYPVRTSEQTLKLSRRYALSLLSLLLLVPAALCLVIDLISGGLTWSIYPAGVLVLIWIDVAVPLLMRKYRLYPTILIAGATLAAYLYMVEQMSAHIGWFLPVVLPALGIATGMLCLTLWLIRSKRLRILHLEALVLVEVGLLCFAIELLCLLAGYAATITWSLYVIMPCFFLALLLYVVSKNGPLSTELKRRFHF